MAFREWFIGDELPVLSGSITMSGDLTGYTIAGRLIRKDAPSAAAVDIDARCSITDAANKTYEVALEAADIDSTGTYEVVLRFTSSTSKPFTIRHPLQLVAVNSPF